MSQHIVPTVLFWACLGGVCYAYAGYPVLIWAAARMFGRSRQRPARDPATPPSVSIVIVARNEDDVIGARVVNAIATDYPAGRFEVVVASDGSTDRTVDVVREHWDPRVRLIDLPGPRGKARVINEVVPALDSDVVILSDANTVVEPDAVGRIVRGLGAPDVGVVVGRLVLTDPETGTNVDSVYWRYETFLKRCEGKLGALLGANGAIYGFHRRVFVPLPPDTLVDDFVLPLLIKQSFRCAIAYDPDSVAYEETPPHLGSEFHRRSRIGAGAIGSLRVLWPLLSPAHGWTAFALASHKLLRWLCPALLVGAVAANLLLLDSGFFRFTLAAQIAFYGAAAAGALVPGHAVPIRALRLATLFTSMNAALVTGFWRWSIGRREATWQARARSVERIGADKLPAA